MDEQKSEESPQISEPPTELQPICDLVDDKTKTNQQIFDELVARCPPDFTLPLILTEDDVLMHRDEEEQAEVDKRSIRVRWMIDNCSHVMPLPKRRAGKVTLPDLRLCTVAEKFVEESPVTYHYHLVDGFSICDRRGRHQQVSDKQIIPFIGRFANLCQVMTKRGPKLFDPSTGKLKSLIEQLSLQDDVYLLPKFAAPSGINGKYEGREMLAMRNGLLDITDRFNPILLPHDRDYYTFHYRDFDYVPDAEAPTWLAALGEYFKNEDGSPDVLARDTIHNWTLRFLTNDTSIQKIPVIIGEPRSGKGTISRVVQRIVGYEACEPITTSSIAGNFGLQNLPGKKLAIMYDANVNGSSVDMGRAVEVLKNISGGDSLTIARKYLPNLTHHNLNLNCFVFSNKILNLQDNTGALTTRWEPMWTTGSYDGRVDPSIEARIHRDDMPGIFNHIIKAKTGVVSHPMADIMMDTMKDLSNSFEAWARDDCIFDKSRAIPVDIAWVYYCRWCKRTGTGGKNIMRLAKFRSEIRTGLRNIKITRPWSFDKYKDFEYYNVLALDPDFQMNQQRPYVIEGLDICPEALAKARTPRP